MTNSGKYDVDAVIVGAGFSGLYLIYKLRKLGLSLKVFEKADDVGGTWYWNRYPGARCDVQSLDYSYSFDPELEREWQWSEKYATQPEILAYQRFVADKYDLRQDINFSTRVVCGDWDPECSRWHIRTDSGETISCKFFIMATGCLSIPKSVDIPGAQAYKGESYTTAEWPREAVDFTGKKVAVIGTGSSGIQVIPLISEQAESLTVFQRTPSFVIPARNGEVPKYKIDAFLNDRDLYREKARRSRGGVTVESSGGRALDVSEEERNTRYELAWQKGDFVETLMVFDDLALNLEANRTISDFLRNKYRTIVTDPEVAEKLCPYGYPYATRRPCLHSDYLETFNKPHVKLVDLRKTPIVSITENGVDTSEESLSFDAIVYALGFDAMTGAIDAVEIRGKEGLLLKDKWQDGPKTYLGLMMSGFPNLFTITGPGSPSVLSNMMVSIEQHVDWVSDCLAYMKANQFDELEPTATAEDHWVSHVAEMGDTTLYPRANSWYMGSNVPGKPRVFLPYVGGVGTFRAVCDEVAENDYLGFKFAGVNGAQCNDGVIWPLKPDVGLMLRSMDDLGLPPLEEMGVAGARQFSVEAARQMPAGPEVGEIIDDVIDDGDAALALRLYRPPSRGPHPITVYFHGGGWVVGNHLTDDSFCRYLCANANSLIVSINYRHAPEYRFPAAIEDGMKAIEWAAEHVRELGGIDGKLAVAGWSAGGNIAAVVCQLARDNGSPSLLGQLLVNPITDSDFERQSYREYAKGYILTQSLMRWFWDNYIDKYDRNDPRVAPLRANDLSNLPPAMIVTCEFDPLRDEGAAYADALRASDVPVNYLCCEGQVHTSITAVDAIVTAESTRRSIAQAVAGFFRD